VRLAPFVIVLMLAATPSWAAGPVRGYTVLGAGTQSCGAWIQSRRDNPTVAGAVLSWAQGYLTANNAYVLKDGGYASSPDKDTITTWLDQYCAAHALDAVSVAIAQMAYEIQRAAGVVAP